MKFHLQLRQHVVTSVNEVNSGSADKTEPPLNPNHPSQRIKTPATLKVDCGPGIAFDLPLESNLPILAPKR